MQRHLHIHDCAHRRGGGPDVRQSRGLEAGESVGPGELDEEQVVLDKKVPECRLGQRATTERKDEVVLDVVFPCSADIASQSAKQAVFEGQWSIGHGPVFADGGPLVTLSVDRGAQRGWGGNARRRFDRLLLELQAAVDARPSLARNYRSHGQFVTNFGLGLDRALDSRAGEHSIVVGDQVGEDIGRRSQRRVEPPEQAKEVDVGD